MHHAEKRGEEPVRSDHVPCDILQQAPIKSLRSVYVQRSFYSATVFQKNGMKFLLWKRSTQRLYGFRTVKVLERL